MIAIKRKYKDTNLLGLLCTLLVRRLCGDGRCSVDLSTLVVLLLLLMLLLLLRRWSWWLRRTSTTSTTTSSSTTATTKPLSNSLWIGTLDGPLHCLDLILHPDVKVAQSFRQPRGRRGGHLLAEIAAQVADTDQQAVRLEGGQHQVGAQRVVVVVAQLEPLLEERLQSGHVVRRLLSALVEDAADADGRRGALLAGADAPGVGCLHLPVDGRYKVGQLRGELGDLLGEGRLGAGQRLQALQIKLRRGGWRRW